MGDNNLQKDDETNSSSKRSPDSDDANSHRQNHNHGTKSTNIFMVLLKFIGTLFLIGLIGLVVLFMSCM